MKTLQIISLVLITILIHAGCNKSDDGPQPPPVVEPGGENPGQGGDPEPDPAEYLIENVAIMATEDNRIPFIFNHTDGGKSAMVDQDGDGSFDGMTYSDPGLELQLTFDLDTETGLPVKMYSSEGAVFIYNYKEDYSLLDVAVIQENGNILYERDIETGLGDLSAKAVSIGTAASGDTLEALKGTVSAMSLAWSAGSCIFYGSAISASLGVTLPATVIACGGFLADFLLFVESASDIDNQYSQQINNARALLSLIGDYSGCATQGNLADCISLGLSTVDGILNIVDGIQLLIGEDNIALAEGALISGYGAVKVTLTWDTTSDIDLWVTEPNGTTIYYDYPVSNTDGVLDFDDVDGFGPENIFWNENPPLGNYTVQVHYYGDNGAGITNYTVQIEVQGSVQVFQGTLVAEDQVNTVASFSTDNTGRMASSQKLHKSEKLTFKPLKKQ